MGAKVLVLREASRAGDTAEALRRRGHRPLLLPMERIEATAEPPPRGAWSGFCVTSAHAVAPLARHFPADPRPLLAVGEASAAAARAAGFGEVIAGEGRAERLGGLARVRLGPVAPPLLYAAGQPRTGTLETALTAAGVAFATWEAYCTVPLDPGPDEAAAAGIQAADAVLLLSAGQAAGFLRLAARVPGLDPARMRLLCLSPRVAAALGEGWGRQALVAREPRLAALLDQLDR